MDVEVRKVVNNIMEKMHQVTWWMMELEKIEISGKSIDRKIIEENKDINNLFSGIQLEYKKLENLLVTNTQIENEIMYGLYGNEENEDENGFFGSENRVLSFIKDKFVNEDESNILKTRIEEITNYIRNSYISLRYIPQVDESGNIIEKSIYENTPFEQLVSSEFYLQILNLSIIEKRIESERNQGTLTFIDKGNILYDLGIKEFSKKYAMKILNSKIKHIKSKKDKYGEKEYEEIISKLFEQKYMQYLFDFNCRYNGMIQENDSGKFKSVKKSIDNGTISKLLGMTEFEIEQNIKLNIQDLRKELNYEIDDILNHVKLEEQIKEILNKEKKTKKLQEQNENEIVQVDR